MQGIYAFALARAAARVLRTSKRACVMCQSSGSVVSQTGATYLLPQPHHLEALKVGQRPPLGGLSAGLGPGAVVPLLLDTGLLPGSLDGTVARGADDLVENYGGEGDVGEGSGVAGDGGGGV